MDRHAGRSLLADAEQDKLKEDGFIRRNILTKLKHMLQTELANVHVYATVVVSVSVNVVFIVVVKCILDNSNNEEFDEQCKDDEDCPIRCNEGFPSHHDQSSKQGLHSACCVLALRGSALGHLFALVSKTL